MGIVKYIGGQNLDQQAVVNETLAPAIIDTGSYNDLIDKPKLGKTYSGTTNSSGIYAVTFPVAYSVAPNIQVNIIGGTNKTTCLTTVTTTGFSMLVQVRSDVLGLLPTYANVNAQPIDVLVTEK